MKVFLSGAIEGVDDLAIGWRNEATQQLQSNGYEVIVPLASTLERVFDAPNEIVRRNIYLQRQADLLLVEYNLPNRAYIGTDYELVRALDYGQPAIVWAHETYTGRVYLQHMATVMKPTLEECLDYIFAYYPPSAAECNPYVPRQALL